MKKGLTEIVVVIDKSGSMGAETEEVITGYNQFLDEQRKLPGEARVTLTLFDTAYNILYTRADLRDAMKLTNDTYRTGGMTALLDAVGRTIHEVGTKLAEEAEENRPEKVIFLVITDGHENSSREYTLAKLKESIKGLKNLDVEWLLAGHGDIIAGAEKVKKNFDDVESFYFAYV